jgi:hypothetical protein
MRVPWEFENPLCAEVGMEIYFPDIEDPSHRTHTRTAVSICNRCPYLAECAEWGITQEYFGIWGGLNVDERKRIRSTRGITLKKEDVA